MKKIFRKFKPDEPPAGGGEPKTEPVDVEALKAKLTEEIKKELEQKHKDELEKKEEEAKLTEIEKLRAKNDEIEKKLADFENYTKTKEYNLSFKENALKLGANKPDTLLKLADRTLTPDESVKKLKKELPEMFVKQPTIDDIGGGAKGSAKTNLSAEEAGKLSMEDYIKWRKPKK